MTAVEWLEEQLQKTYIFNQNDFDMFKKAKELEKKQIIDAFKRGTINEMNGIEEIGSEQYYNETFKKDLVI
jgi:translation initiation factor 2 gamma subunit (eIF-2gamma)